MAKARMGVGLVAGCLLLAGGVASAAPSVAQMLNIKPRLKDSIGYSTPSLDEQKACKVELVPGRGRGSSGWLLRDKDGQPLRRFFDTNGDKQIDVWSYYKDGVEVYRETDTKFTGRPTHFRWLNSGGMKWGVDLTSEGKIASWKTISSEEVSQEVFQALAANDVERFKALLISDSEIRALKLPAGQTKSIRESVRKAVADFQAAVAKLPEKAQWGGLESATPQCIPADSLGTDRDLYRYASRTIRCDYGDKQHEWFQTGEMVQVGMAWRLVSGPTQGDDTKRGGVGDPPPKMDKDDVKPELRKALDELGDLDAKTPAASTEPGPNEAIYGYNVKRAEIIERILVLVKPEERENWLKQLADSFSAAAQNNTAKDNPYLERLGQLKDQVVKELPNSALAAYVTFRTLWAEYAPKLAQGGKEFPKVQKAWLEQLSKFVQAYPNGEDTPDALLQLGMGCEFNGEEVQAKNWYKQLAENFPDKPLAAKAKGAIRRLSSDGQVLELSGTTLNNGSFNVSRYRSKIVVVYYWASYCQQADGDFDKLKQLVKNHKGVEVVCVNLDDNRDDALRFLRRVSLSAVHLYQAGGLNSPLAAQYGIMGLPNLFLLDRNNKVASRTVQINDLEDEVKKLLK